MINFYVKLSFGNQDDSVCSTDAPFQKVPKETTEAAALLYAPERG
jgi:hypothetical protein